MNRIASQARFHSYAEFWPFYLSQHSKRGTRYAHFIGTLLALIILIAAVFSHHVTWLSLAFFIGYGSAWLAHRVIENNRPATLTYPFWSLRGDFHMLFLGLTGRLRSELLQYKIDP